MYIIYIYNIYTYIQEVLAYYASFLPQQQMIELLQARHAHTHTQIHTHIHTYTYTFVHTYTYTYTYRSIVSLNPKH
jgi:hypothetical protein